MRTLRRLFLCAPVVLFGACSDVPGPTRPAPEFAISDAVHSDGNEHFFWLPPMVGQPAGFNGAFDGTLAPTVKICEWGGAACAAAPLATFTTTAGPGSETVRVPTGSEHYIVNWHTDEFGLDPTKTYRISTLVGGAELGYADMDVVSSGKELRNVNTNEYIPLVNGRTLPIKFRIEVGAVFVVGSGGGTITAANGAVQLGIPAGALTTDVVITVDPVSGFPTDQSLIAGAVFDIQPSGTAFSTPVTLTLTYSEANLGGIPENTLTILELEAGEWVEVSGSTVDAIANTVSTPITGLGTIGAAGAVTTVEVSPASATLDVAETVQLTATPKDGAGNTVNRAVTWSSPNGGVATVNGTGLVTAVAPGSVAIEALSGGATGTSDITVSGGALPPNPHRISGGFRHTCALTDGGTAYCWGLNGGGQVGDGTTTNRSAPVAVSGGLTWHSVSAGALHTCGLTPAGAAHCWGSNSDGQLGNGTTTNSSVPVAVAGGLTFQSVRTGNNHSCGLTPAGAAYCWGRGGNIGTGTTIRSTVPVAVVGGLTFQALTVGGSHSCGLTPAGAAHCWGANNFGQSGDGTTTDRYAPVAVAGGLTFASLDAGGASHTCGLTPAGAAYCWGFGGQGQLGQGAYANSSVPVAVGPPASGPVTWALLALANPNSCALTTAGDAYCWGGGFLGDGTNSGGNQVPVAVSAPASGPVTYTTLSGGGFHTCGLTSAGGAFCWGENLFGQVGDGTTTGPSLVPIAVLPPIGVTPPPPPSPHRISGGFRHTCALTDGGTAYCWGLNGGGQVGDGTTTNRSAPVAVSGGLTWHSVSAGALHTCGLTPAGAAHCWGSNSDGQLGNGTTTNSSVPVAVAGGLTFQSVRTGNNHSCGLTPAGAAYCWGRGGNIGTGTTIRSTVPVAVVGGLTFQALTVGGSHSCGLTPAGAAHCWGANNFGQSGDGTTTDRYAPVAVAGGLTFASLDAGGASHTCGLTPAGAAYCWGFGGQGQLGQGAYANSSVPVAVGPPASGPVTWALLALANPNSCALTTAGDAYCWGGGFLGDGTNSGGNQVPVAVSAPASGPVTYTTLSGGGFHTCGLTSAGGAFCWGENLFGQVGDGTTTGPSLVPIAVLPPIGNP